MLVFQRLSRWTSFSLLPGGYLSGLNLIIDFIDKPFKIIFDLLNTFFEFKSFGSNPTKYFGSIQIFIFNFAKLIN